MIIRLNDEYRINGDRYQCFMEQFKPYAEGEQGTNPEGGNWYRVSGYCARLEEMLKSFAYKDLMGKEINVKLDKIVDMIEKQNEFLADISETLQEPLHDFMVEGAKRGKRKNG